MKSEFKQVNELFVKGDLVESSCYIGVVTRVQNSEITVCTLHRKSRVDALSVGDSCVYDITELKKTKGSLTLTQE